MCTRCSSHSMIEDRVGVVVIGRNEGERLVRCLQSLKGHIEQLVYVDSGSTDDSVSSAHELGASVVELDDRSPFSAARARNEGFELLIQDHPRIEYVQFVDGDCEVQPSWIPRAVATLDSDPSTAAVAGRRRERHPEASPYNRLADMEWNTPVGEVGAIGGDVLLRVDAFQKVGGYDLRFIAGEDPELCLRLRQAGHRIRRIDGEMTRHDAAIFRVEQWWRRNVRAGHAYAQTADVHRFRSEMGRTMLSIFAWGGVVPIVGVGGVLPTLGTSLSVFSGYAVLWARVWRRCRSRGYDASESSLYATAIVGGKIAEFQGVCHYVWHRYVLERAAELIEYK